MLSCKLPSPLSYCSLITTNSDARNVYKFSGLADEEAAFGEPLSNTIGALNKLNSPVRIDVCSIVESIRCFTSGAGR